MTRRHWLVMAFLLMWQASTPAMAQDASRAVLNAISQYLVRGGTDILSPILSDIGFTPASSSMWRSFSSSAKLEYVYWSAEAGRPGDGNRAIAATADRLSKQYNPIKNNDTIMDYVSRYNQSTKFVWKTPSPGSENVSPEAKQVIDSISRYVDRATYRALTESFKLSEATARAIMATSKSTNEALLRGFDSVPEGDKEGRLGKLVDDVGSEYPTLLSEAAIVTFLHDDPFGECMCGTRPLGYMRRSQCHPGQRCF
jgi:hypothetical protein